VNLECISEKNVNNAQMVVQKNYAIDLLIIEKNEHMTKVVAEACRTVTELDIPKDASVDVRIRKLTVGVREERTELSKLQFELNLKITELELRAQPSTPLEVKEQRTTAVKDAVAAVDVAVKDCTALFE